MFRRNTFSAKSKPYRSRGCLFCRDKTKPNFKEPETLRKFITERGKIVGRAKTGVCAAHQRGLAYSIKRARILAILPFVPKV